MKNKLIIFASAFLAALPSINIVSAHDYHHHETQTETIVTTNTVMMTQEGAALSDAFSQIDCTFTSHKWHGGIGLGFNEEYVAPAAGICKRWGETQIKGTFGVEHGKKRGGIGVMFQFE